MTQVTIDKGELDKLKKAAKLYWEWKDAQEAIEAADADERNGTLIRGKRLRDFV